MKGRSKRFGTKNSKVPTPTNGDETRRCVACSKTFTTSARLKRHMLSHTGERPYCCTECDRTFLCSSHLKEHLTVHSKSCEPQHQCPTCEKTFNRRSNLSRHLLIHKDQRPFECENCGKAFTQSGDLKRHSVVHNAERSHFCEKCNKTFSQRSSFMRHMLKHSKQRLQCPYCCATYTRKYLMDQHISTHSIDKGHHCATCDAYFIDATTLKIHLRKHSVKKQPLKCATCHKSYVNRYQLKKHLNSHEDFCLASNWVPPMLDEV